MQLPGQIGDVRQVMEVCEVWQMQAQDMMVWLHQEQQCAEIDGDMPYARRGRKTVTDKVDVGNNPRDGNVCWKYLSRGLSRCKLRGKMHSDGADLAVCCSSHIRTPYADT